ncbi:hypothetical protein [Salinimicrobium sp. GXAS 041]|uniref:hypothetical protein n=1 Tax=Salinimicrobium sp. GXAS 041 TaxID=3400806 RepID=UPI003C7926CE
MRHLKLLFAVVAMTMTSLMAANPDPKGGAKSVSSEIEKMLINSNLIVEDDFTLRMVFSLSEEKEIKVHSIDSENQEVNDFLMKRLQNRRVFGRSWVKGKIYELPVKVEAVR